jgi:hypothetical protein
MCKLGQVGVVMIPTLSSQRTQPRPGGAFFESEPRPWGRPGLGANDGMSGGQVSLARKTMGGLCAAAYSSLEGGITRRVTIIGIAPILIRDQRAMHPPITCKRITIGSLETPPRTDRR